MNPQVPEKIQKGSQALRGSTLKSLSEARLASRKVSVRTVTLHSLYLKVYRAQGPRRPSVLGCHIPVYTTAVLKT